ncbi:MAG: hypothetical protein J3R72DRAFT_448714 [Linnemannia gamsii]|nr:MAG: hypothetical protein J3R72DRAFT_448714 [Linnemannia gamsii]
MRFSSFLLSIFLLFWGLAKKKPNELLCSDEFWTKTGVLSARKRKQKRREKVKTRTGTPINACARWGEGEGCTGRRWR